MQKFSSIAELRLQIEEDVVRARALLADARVLDPVREHPEDALASPEDALPALEENERNV